MSCAELELLAAAKAQNLKSSLKAQQNVYELIREVRIKMKKSWMISTEPQRSLSSRSEF
jgi:hypothetical protein